MKATILFFLITISQACLSQIATLRYRYLSNLTKSSTIDRPIIVKTSYDYYMISIYENSYTITSAIEVLGTCTNIKFREEYSAALRRDVMVFSDGKKSMIIDSLKDIVFILFNDGTKFLMYN